MKTHRVFISQPMNGKTDEEIAAVRELAVEAVKGHLGEECDIKVIDSFLTCENPVGWNAGLYYLGESIRLMSGADIAYFAKGWELARGCKIEHLCAIEYGIPILEDMREESHI